MEKVDKSPITDQTIQNFLQYKKDKSGSLKALKALYMGLACLAIYLGRGLVLYTGNHINLFAVPIVIFGAIYFVASFSGKFDQPFEPRFKILEAWERIVGCPASSTFPVTAEHRAIIGEWAKGRLQDLAVTATYSFDYQARVRSSMAEHLGKVLIPTEAGSIYKKTKEQIEHADSMATNDQRDFLEFWDLVTEKGAGILTGEKWSNPEKYRKNILESEVYDNL